MADQSACPRCQSRAGQLQLMLDEAKQEFDAYGDTVPCDSFVDIGVLSERVRLLRQLLTQEVKENQNGNP